MSPMQMSEITTTINTRINELKARVNSLPVAGGLECLDAELTRIKNEIKMFQDFLAEANAENEAP